MKRRRMFSTERKNANEQNKVIQQRQWPRHLGVILDSAIVILFSNNESIKREKCKPTSFRSHPRYQQRFSLKFSTISNINIHNKQQPHGIKRRISNYFTDKLFIRHVYLRTRVGIRN